MNCLLHSTDNTKVSLGLTDGCEIQPYFVELFATNVLTCEIPENPCGFCVVTSQRTVNWLLENRTWITFLKQVPVYVVGLQTAKMCVDIGLNVVVDSPRGFEELKPKLPLVGGLFLGAKEPSKPIREWIESGSHQHCSCYCFDRLSQLPDIEWEKVSIVLATSPKIAQCFIELGLPTTIPVVVLGNLTKETILSIGNYNVHLSPVPTITATVQWTSSVLFEP